MFSVTQFTEVKHNPTSIGVLGGPAGLKHDAFVDVHMESGDAVKLECFDHSHSIILKKENIQCWYSKNSTCEFVWCAG